MDDSANTNIEVNQKAAPGSNATQIGQQINNYGMTPEQAFQIVMDLFNQNFPKLQALAKETAEKRANEFCQEVIQKIVNNGIQDFSSLADPDVQYILYEAQKNYARFGTSEMLSTLTELIAKRVVHDNEFILKVTIWQSLLLPAMKTRIFRFQSQATTLGAPIRFQFVKRITRPAPMSTITFQPVPVESLSASMAP